MAGRVRLVRCNSMMIALVGLLLAGCGNQEGAGNQGGDGGYPSTPEDSVEGKEQFYFDNLAGMTENSTLVVRAEVTKVGVGETYGEDSGSPITTRSITLKPVEVARGDVAVGQPLIYEEEGWNADRTGYVMNGVLWSEVGDQGWYYLRRSNSGHYRLINSYGRYKVADDDHKGPSGHHPAKEGPWAQFPATVRNDAGKIGQIIRTTAERGNK